MSNNNVILQQANRFVEQRNLLDSRQAFEDAVRDVDQWIEPTMAQVPCEQRSRRRAIDVIIPEDRDLLATHGRMGNACRGRFHLRHRGGIWKQPADRRVEKISLNESVH